MKKILFALIFLLIICLPTLSKDPVYYEQVYKSKEDALKIIFKDLEVSEKEIEIDKDTKKKLQKKIKRKIKTKKFNYFIGKKSPDQKPELYSLILDEKGKHFPMTFMVGITKDLKIKKVIVMVYREKRGSNVRRNRFLGQFKNKTIKDPLEINTDIIHLTGATISSWSISYGVKKALAIVEEIIKQTNKADEAKI